MRTLTISAFALLTFTSAWPQVGNTWSDRLDSISSGIIDPPKWSAQLEGIHVGHIPPPSPAVDNPVNHWGRLAIWGHGVPDDSGEGRSTQMYVFDTKPDPVMGKFIDQSGNPTVNPMPNLLLSGVDCFCAGQTGDKNGDLLIVGGALEGHAIGIKDVNRFKFQNLSWESVKLMDYPRWYPTAVTLANGNILTVAGIDATGQGHSDIPELFNTTTGQWSIFNAVVQWPEAPFWRPFDSDPYPFMFAIHDSTDPKVFWAGKRRHTAHQQSNEAGRSHILNMTSLVYEPVTAGNPPWEGSGAVMWIDGTNPVSKGKIIKVGGNGTSFTVRDRKYFNASEKVGQINLDNADPFWTSLPDLAEATIDCNMVLLPNGKLLVVGGAKYDHDYVAIQKLSSHAVRTTQMFDPANPTSPWDDDLLPMPDADRRWYHSTAVLLPDGSVLSAGSNNEFNGRIYYPPYFSQARPTIESAPATVTYGNNFNVTVGAGQTISKVTLLRLAATTHGFDQGQRFISCTFNQAGQNLSVTRPASGGVAPPGYYMLFVVFANGAPSHARYVKVGP